MEPLPYLQDNEVLHGDLLLATERRPNTKRLHPKASGIEVDERGNVKADEHSRTTCEGVYAIGDVTGGPAFTHVSWEDHRRLKATLGGTLVGPEAAKLIHVFVALMQAGATWHTLARSVHIHPTFADGLQTLGTQFQSRYWVTGEPYYGHPRHKETLCIARISTGTDAKEASSRSSCRSS